jgi:ferrous iron transport protein A
VITVINFDENAWEKCMGNNGKKPISKFPSGSKVRVESTEGCCRARGRLCAMGLTPGTFCEVLSGGSMGPCRVRVRDTDVVIGHGMAEKILASPADGESEGRTASCEEGCPKGSERIIG